MSKLKNRVEKLEVVRGDGLKPVLLWVTDTDGTSSVPGFTPDTKEYASEAEALTAHPELLEEGNHVIHIVLVEGVNGKPVIHNSDGTFTVGEEVFTTRAEMYAAYPSGGSTRNIPPANVKRGDHREAT